jgi:hypothetical protein
MSMSAPSRERIDVRDLEIDAIVVAFVQPLTAASPLLGADSLALLGVEDDADEEDDDEDEDWDDEDDDEEWDDEDEDDDDDDDEDELGWDDEDEDDVDEDEE